MKIGEYADVIRKNLIVVRYHNQDGRWCARLEHAEGKDNETSACLTSWHGNGTSPEAAIQDYINKITGKFLIFDAMDQTKRREYGVPQGLEP